MEEIKLILTEHWPTILQYVTMIIAYFLVFLFRNKVNTVKTNLTTVFKENMQIVSKTDTDLRTDVEAKLNESIANYEAAVSKISSLEQEIDRQKRVTEALLGGKNEETSTDADDETTDT